MFNVKLFHSCINIRQYIHKYLKYIEFNKVQSQNTCRAYYIDLRQLLINYHSVIGHFFSPRGWELYINLSQDESVFGLEDDLFSGIVPQRVVRGIFSKRNLQNSDKEAAESRRSNPLWGQNRIASLEKKWVEEVVNCSFKKWASLSAASRNRKYACLKAFLSWLFVHGGVDEDMQSWIKLPRVPQRVPYYLSVDEALYLIKTVQKKASEKEKDRDLLLILLLYGGGLRISEACDMHWNQVDIANGCLRILGKGGKERLVTVPQVVLKELSRCQPTNRQGRPLSKRDLQQNKGMSSSVKESPKGSDMCFSGKSPAGI